MKFLIVKILFIISAISLGLLAMGIIECPKNYNFEALRLYWSAVIVAGSFPAIGLWLLLPQKAVDFMNRF